MSTQVSLHLFFKKDVINLGVLCSSNRTKLTLSVSLYFKTYCFSFSFVENECNNYTTLPLSSCGSRLGIRASFKWQVGSCKFKFYRKVQENCPSADLNSKRFSDFLESEVFVLSLIYFAHLLQSHLC